MIRKKNNLRTSSSLIAIISTIKKEFSIVRSTSILLAGKIIVIILTIILTPIITRLFQPEDYGQFSLYSTVIQVLVTIGTLTFPLAIVNVRKSLVNKAYRSSLKATIISASLLIPLLYSIFRIDIFPQLSDLMLNQYWYLLAIGFLFTALNNIYRSVRQRAGDFTRLSKVSVLEATIAKFLNVLFGSLGFVGTGLILSDILSRGISSLALWKRFNLNIDREEILNKESSIKEYPLIVMPSEVLGLLGTLLIVWFLTFNFSLVETGRYWLAFGLLSIPLNMLTNSIQPTFTQNLVQSVELQDKSPNKHFITVIIIVSLLTFTPFLIISENILICYFGAEWYGIGLFIKLVAIWFAPLLVDRIIENSFYIFRKESMILIINAFDLGAQLIVMILTWIYDLDLHILISLFVFVKVIISILKIYLAYNLISLKHP